jgi:hypothetical protein
MRVESRLNECEKWRYTYCIGLLYARHAVKYYSVAISTRIEYDLLFLLIVR